MRYIDYLPEVLTNVQEFKALDTAFDSQFDTISQKACQTLKEPIIQTASDKGIQRFEKLLGLSRQGKTLEQRRKEVTSRLVRAPFTENWLLHSLIARYGQDGADVYLERDKYRVCIELLQKDDAVLNEIYSEFASVIPANMELSVKSAKRERTDLNFTATVTVADIIEYVQ